MQAQGKVNYMVSLSDSGKKPLKTRNRGYVWIVVMVVLASLATVGVVSAASIAITGPTTISVPGNYYLANDIVNSDVPIGISITAPNVVLDGKGKKIDGIDSSGTMGIRIYNAGMTLFNVIIKNVIITDWGTGIRTSDVKNSQIDSVTIKSGVNNGISLWGSARNTVKNCIVDQNGWSGIYLWATSNSNTLTGNTVTGNGVNGIAIQSSNNNEILNNKVQNNLGAGIYLYETSNFNTITGNTITGSTGDGINIKTSNDNFAYKNTLKNNGGGISVHVDANNNEISQNTVTNATLNGVYVGDNSNNNVFIGNTLEKNGVGIKIYNNNRNTVINNLVKDNVNQGIWLRDSGTNVIVNNYFYNNQNSYLASGLASNTWNLTRSDQKSITGGANSGGNSWGQPNGLGFSQVTPATNGICNQPYTLATNNVDKLPLKWAKK